MAEPSAIDGEFADLQVLLATLLPSLEALVFIGRNLNPPEFPAVMLAAGTPDNDLRAARPRLDGWPDRLAPLRAPLAAAGDAALAAFEALRSASDLRDMFRALRFLPRAEEALYPLTAALEPVSRYFLDPPSRGDADLLALLDQAEGREETGVFHADHENGARGGFSVYVPEYYRPDRSWPLVMALHGGSGNGRGFLWSWLAAARGAGAILVAPTAIGETWALMGDDVDTPNLTRILGLVGDRWWLDPERRLLTGLSDGGTFTYVSGLEGGSPFTHLAPVAAAFHPMLAEMADPGRIRGLPVFVVHGALDWMFDVELARQAQRALAGAGAEVTYREIADLSHCYPREVNREILAWLQGPTG
ncbi:MAG: phospholipase [Caulobacteraceae bacterium]|nr:phospholipase [Caulobacteraceae bacterium]